MPRCAKNASCVPFSLTIRFRIVSRSLILWAYFTRKTLAHHLHAQPPGYSHSIVSELLMGDLVLYCTHPQRKKHGFSSTVFKALPLFLLLASPQGVQSNAPEALRSSITTSRAARYELLAGRGSLLR